MKRLIDFSNVVLYAVTPELMDDRVLLEKTQQLLDGGVDVVQLRSHQRSDRDMIRLGQAIRHMCTMAGALFIMNNRPDLALVCDADGVHLGHTDMAIPDARKILGFKRIIGASAHSVVQALDAQKAGADYVSCGPIWTTPTKPEYESVGLGLIDLYRASVTIPFVVIGGVNLKNLSDVISHGAKRVAVVRALFEADQPAACARSFREQILKNWKSEELEILELKK